MLPVAFWPIMPVPCATLSIYLSLTYFTTHAQHVGAFAPAPSTPLHVPVIIRRNACTRPMNAPYQVRTGTLLDVPIAL